MVSHILHDRQNDEVLQDGCPRCDEHADHPFRSLDATHLNRLADEWIEVEYGDNPNAVYRSLNDRRACYRIYEAAMFAAKHPQLVSRIKDAAKI